MKMTTTMSSQFRFISVADPMAPASAETRSATHSHAISHVHARRKQGLRKNGKPKTKNIGSCTTKTKQITASEVQPVSLLCSVPNDACDPFQTLGLPLSEQDYFLLAYCKYNDSQRPPLIRDYGYVTYHLGQIIV